MGADSSDSGFCGNQFQLWFRLCLFHLSYTCTYKSEIPRIDYVISRDE